MSFFTALFYDAFMAKTEKACLTEWRGNLLKQVHGDVLEIGAGTGANIQFYPKDNMQLTLSEPDINMREQLFEKVKNEGLDHIEVTHDSIESIDAENSVFDFVVSSLVCCSVPNLGLALDEVHRILKPNGCFIFLEHVGAEKGTGRRRWQNGITPVWRKIAGNCHLNRDTESAIAHARFTLKEIKRESMRKALPILRPTIRGIAVKS